LIFQDYYYYFFFSEKEVDIGRHEKEINDNPEKRWWENWGNWENWCSRKVIV
jgi:hypothetical protein